MLLGHYNFYTFPLLVFSLFTTVVMGIIMVSYINYQVKDLVQERHFDTDSYLDYYLVKI